jgi:hypothetical protein
MRERVAQILKIVSFGLVVLLVVQLVKVAFRVNPLANASIPDVPTLPADTNAPPAVATKALAKPGTNGPVAAMTSNAPAALSTNAVAHRKTKPTDSNAAPVSVAAETNSINANNLSTNMAIAVSTDTNVVVAKVKSTGSNAAPVALAAEMSATNNSPTNSAVLTDTNVAVAKLATGTNVAVVESGKTNGSNSAMAKASGPRKPPTMPPQMMGGPMGPGGAKAAKLPPEVQARVDRVTESEILAPINHPMPMALLGIAGNMAFLRSPSGQTGLVKEGDNLGEIKLLRIGTNRVLVEQDGQPKELMIFSGLGGESLVSKPTATSDETTKNENPLHK